MLQLTFQLDPTGKAPLYEQLYAAIAEQIRSGSLAPNTKLPSKRRLAAELSVSVNTVDTAYQILTAEGYLESRARSGFFTQSFRTVQPFADALGAGHGSQASNVTQGGAADKTAHSGRQNNAAPRTANDAQNGEANRNACAPAPRFDLSGTGIDPALFPFRTWGRIQKELLYSAPDLLLRGDAQGDAALREALAEYLGAVRGVRCAPEQIVVGAGMEYLLSLLAPLLPAQGGLEHPGYPRAKTVLENNGIACTHLPLDDKGLSIEALQASGVGFCYVTPSHQYPTGVTMPAGRRAELLHWANGVEIAQEKPTHADDARNGGETQTGIAMGAVPARYIIEDDYDSEFRFDVRPLPSLQGMSGADGRVIYLATFSKSLAPSIRIAAMVLPTPLLGAWQARYGHYASTVSRYDQQTLCRFLGEGYFTRHLARARGIYKARRNALVQALEAAFGSENICLHGLHTGLHLLLQIKNRSDDSDIAIASRCAAAGVRVTPLSASYTDGAKTCPPNTVLLGYATLQEADASEAAQRMAAAIFTPAS